MNRVAFSGQGPKTRRSASGMQRALRAFRLGTAVLGLMLLGACGNMPVTMSGGLSTPYQIQVNDWVYRNPPIVYVHPTGTPAQLPTGLFVPFRATQSMNNSVAISRNLTRQIWQVWLSQQAFSALAYDEQAQPFELHQALALARRRGASLLIGGYINHYMDGGTVGDSSVSLAIEVYDVATGQLYFSMAQGGSMEKQQANDFYVFQVQARMPPDPVGLILRTLASDMGMEMYYWVYPDARKKKGFGFGGKGF